METLLLRFYLQYQKVNLGARLLLYGRVKVVTGLYEIRFKEKAGIMMKLRAGNKIQGVMEQPDDTTDQRRRHYGTAAANR